MSLWTSTGSLVLCVTRIPGENSGVIIFLRWHVVHEENNINQVNWHYEFDTKLLAYFSTENFLNLLFLPVFLAASRVCEEPASAKPHTWPDDITQWPVRGHCYQLGITCLINLFISLFKQGFFTQ